MACAAGFLGVSCQQDASTSTEGSDSKQKTTQQVSKGSFGAPVSQERHPETPMLCKDHWVFEFYVSGDVRTDIANKGRWYKFSADGTFLSGQWEEAQARGSWRFDRRPFEDFVPIDAETGKPISQDELHLILDSEQDEQDADFIVIFAPSGEVGSWMGAKGTRLEGISVKAINLIDRPTKKQFGVE